MEDNNNNSFGDRIKIIRKLKGYTIEEFSKKISVAYHPLYRWEHNIADIKLETLQRILKIYPEYASYLVVGHLDNLSAQEIPNQKNNNTTLIDIYDEYLQHHQTEYPATAYSQKLTFKIIIAFFGNKPIKLLTNYDINDFKAQRLKSVAVSTTNRNLSVLSAILNYYRDHINQKFLPPKIKLLKNLRSVPPKFYLKNELNKVYQANKELAHIWQFIANTGLRVSEFYNLKWENVAANEITVVSTQQHRNKSRKHRLIPLNVAAKRALSMFVKNNSEYVSERFSSGDIYKKRFRKICNAVGLQNKAGIHCLRHTFASHLVQNGVPMRKIQKLMGHASITTTENYAHLIFDDLNKEVAKIDL